MTSRWPEPRPPLSLPRPSAHGSAVLLGGPVHPTLPPGHTWLLEADAPTAAAHAGRAFELELDLRWTRSGCTRLFELVLLTYAKPDAAGARTRLGSFRHVFHPTDAGALRPLLRLGRQPWWWLVVRGPDGVAASVELANTLELEGLLRRVWDGRG
ncbi:MAG: hypothetical protein H6732_14450 [Alphaproteobacteria bacterium]|nr:hypothetical protein [Alphaproteobacteria bacterium]